MYHALTFAFDFLIPDSYLLVGGYEAPLSAKFTSQMLHQCVQDYLTCTTMTPDERESEASKLERFHIKDIVYKEVNGHPIPASVLIPKNVQPGKHPVMVRWHGGGFVTGHRLFAEW